MTENTKSDKELEQAIEALRKGETLPIIAVEQDKESTAGTLETRVNKVVPL